MKGVCRPLAAVYNFFNMFHKDSGAHFTYNMGVSMMRIGLLCFAFVVLLVLEYIFLDSPKLRRRDKVDVTVESVDTRDTDKGTVYEVTLHGFSRDGEEFEQTQQCTYMSYDFYTDKCGNGVAYPFLRYTVRGRDDFIAYGSWLYVGWEYHRAYPDTPPPVPMWGIPIALAIMALFFYMGKKEINISMKYPRSDVPEEVSGAPVLRPEGMGGYYDPGQGFVTGTGSGSAGFLEGSENE